MEYDYFEEVYQYMNREQNKQLKEHFKGLIKGSFLITIKSKIIDNDRYLKILDDTDSSKDNSILLSHENNNFEICKMITLTHRFNCELLSDEERRKKEQNIKYQTELVDEVINMFYYKTKSNQIKKSDLLESYNPVNYYSYVCSSMLEEKIIAMETNNQMETINLVNILNIIYKIKSVLILLDNKHVVDGISIIRNLIELYATTSAINDENTAKSYFKYQKWLVSYIDDGEYDDEFLELYNKENERHLYPISKINYLRYGWINKTDIQVGKGINAYNIKDLFNILNKKYPNEMFGVYLYEYYISTSLYIHSNHAINYLEITPFVSYSIKELLTKMIIKVYDRINELFNIEIENEPINLLSMIKKLSSISENRKKIYDKTK